MAKPLKAGGGPIMWRYVLINFYLNVLLKILKHIKFIDALNGKQSKEGKMEKLIIVWGKMIQESGR